MLRNKTNQNVFVHTGDTANVIVNFVDSASQAIDITATNIVYTVYATPTGAPLITKAAGVDFGAYGASIQIPLAPSDTATPGNYFHKLVMTDAAGHVFTVVLGIIIFTADLLSDVRIALTAVLDESIYVYSYLLNFARDSQYVFTLFDEVL